MKRCIVILVLSSFIIMAASTSAQDWWPMFQHDSSNTGYSTSDGPNTSQISWIFEAGATGPPAVAEGKVYIGIGRFLYCLDAVGNGDGTTDLIWSFSNEEGSEIEHSPAVWDGKVYFESESGPIYCVDAAGNGDGTTDLIWSYGNGIFYSHPVVAAGRLYISSGAEVTCLDAIGNGDGTTDLIWFYNYEYNRINGRDSSLSNIVPVSRRPSVAIADGMVYATAFGFYDDESYVYGLDAVGNGDGTTDLIWSFTVGYIYLASPTIAYGNVYIGCRDHVVYCLDAIGNGDGTTNLIWSFDAGGEIYSTPAIYDSRAYISSLGTNYCLDAFGNGDGTTDMIWSFSGGCSSGHAVADGKVYIEGISCLDAIGNGDGTTDLIWSYGAGGRSPAVADGKVFVGSAGYIYAFGPITDAVPTLSEWGMIILGLLLLVAGTVAVICRRKEAFADEH